MANCSIEGAKNEWGKVRDEGAAGRFPVRNEAKAGRLIRVRSVVPLRIVRSTHGWRRLPYTVIHFLPPSSPVYTQKGAVEAEIYKAFSAIGALRQTRLIPGSKVKVWVPQIVHARRVRAARKLYKSI